MVEDYVLHFIIHYYICMMYITVQQTIPTQHNERLTVFWLQFCITY
jgi:hypothetical protein